MDQNPPIPRSLPDLSEAMRKFLAGVRDDEIANLKLLVEMDGEERDKLDYLVKHFSVEDLGVIADSLENLRAMRRFGTFGAWVFGIIVAAASAVAVIKSFLLPGKP